MKRLLLLHLLVLVIAVQICWADTPKTMSYQGVLTDDGGTVASDGTYQLTFSLYDAETTGNLEWTETHEAVAVTNGIFSVILGSTDPLSIGFDEEYWLGVSVDGGAELTPRTRLTAAPYSLGGDFWKLSGNAGTDPATNFLGTTDNTPLELWVNNLRILRLEPNSNGPNIVAGYSGNSVSQYVSCATISGGGRFGQENVVTSSYGTVGGGHGNWAGDDDATFDDALCCTVSGGQNNQTGHHYASIGGGVFNKANGYASTIPGGYENEISGNYATIGGGVGNLASASYAAIGGGGSQTTYLANRVTDSYGTIGGGKNNQVGNDNADTEDAIYATIGGGIGNSAIAKYATISGGGSETANLGNRVNDNYGTVGGGKHNVAGNSDDILDNAMYATVGGGEDNTATSSRSTVSGGWDNHATNDNATIGGGSENGARGRNSTVGGGVANNVYDDSGTIGGGGGNTANGAYCTIAGGRTNGTEGNYSTVGGGWDNHAAADYATIAGGGRSDPGDFATGNRVTDKYGTIGGGGNNQAGDADADPEDAIYATVGGGRNNIASFREATVGGGRDNTAGKYYATVAGGGFNVATGWYSAVPGGYANEANGWCSFAAGMRAKADNTGTFVWADAPDISEGIDFYSTTNNEFAVRCTGGARFVTQIDGSGNPTKWAYLDPASATWSSLSSSDRDAKTNITPVDKCDILERLASISVRSWNYRDQDFIRHIGPMAQDFYAAFSLGASEKYIDSVDADGVALAAIQGLYDMLKEKEEQISDQKRQIEDLEERLSNLERLLSSGNEQ